MGWTLIPLGKMLVDLKVIWMRCLAFEFGALAFGKVYNRSPSSRPSVPRSKPPHLRALPSEGLPWSSHVGTLPQSEGLLPSRSSCLPVPPLKGALFQVSTPHHATPRHVTPRHHATSTPTRPPTPSVTTPRCTTLHNDTEVEKCVM